MAVVSGYIDTITNVYRQRSRRSIASRSIYSEVPHPGTNKKIEGWKWDHRLWPTKNELEAISYAPSLYDPDLSGADTTDFQSGIGDNNDLLLLDVEQVNLEGIHHWAPKLNHGYYYINDEEWYLYADQYLTEYFTEVNVSGTHQILDLSHNPKPTIPIQVRRYKFDRENSQYKVHLDARKKIEFSASGTEPEFIVNEDYNPVRLELNGTWTDEIGVPVVVLPDDINSLELLGISTGEANQEFQTEFYPIDRLQPIELWVWSDPTSPTEWTLISGLDTVSGLEKEAYIDYDVGTISFGNYNPTTTSGDGYIPPVGRKIGITYTAGLAAHYEPEFSEDYIVPLNSQSNLNPVYSAINGGFVQLNTQILEPDSIFLEADLPRINPYLIDLGNNVGELTATVYTRNGSPIEGAEVFFEILDPVIGTLGGSSETISAVTRTGGQAVTLFNSPNTALDAGQATTEITVTGLDTIIYVDGLTDPGDVTRLFTYKVHEEDLILGIPEANVDSYYTSYLAEEGMVSGIQGTQDYEEDFRSINELPTPNTYEVGDIVTGKKTILLKVEPAASAIINPNTGDLTTGTTFSPLYPTTIEDVTTGDVPRLKLTYENVTLSLPTVSGVKSYFLIGDAQTSIRAYTVNQRTNKRLYSNTIQMKITIPDNLSGSYIVDDLNDLSNTLISGLLLKPRDITALSDVTVNTTSGITSFYEDYLVERSGINEDYAEWFKRTRKADSAGLNFADEELSVSSFGPEPITLVAGNAEIPLGFRLKSTGITAASVLDQVTFITPNDILLSGYFT